MKQNCGESGAFDRSDMVSCGGGVGEEREESRDQKKDARMMRCEYDVQRIELLYDQNQNLLKLMMIAIKRQLS